MLLGLHRPLLLSLRSDAANLIPLIATWLLGCTIIGLIVERVTLPRDPAPVLDLSEEVSEATAAIDETLRTAQVLTDKRELRQLRDEAYSARRRWTLHRGRP